MRTIGELIVLLAAIIYLTGVVRYTVRNVAWRRMPGYARLSLLWKGIKAKIGGVRWTRF